MPLGLAVVPEVYMMKSVCSAGKNSGVCSSLWRSTVSCHQWSRPSTHLTSPAVRRTTSTAFTLGQLSRASSTAGFNGAGAPRRKAPSAVTTKVQSESRMRLERASAENPAKTTEWMAPRRTMASRVTTASGIIGM
jgi:hypothetical protein